MIQKISDLLEHSLTYKNRLQLSTHYLLSYISNFHVNILFNNSLIPINSIAFLFSGSGTGKDKSINKLKDLFSNGYDIIENHIQMLIDDMNKGKEKPKSFKYVIGDIELSTPEGLLANLDKLTKLGLGSNNVNTNEFLGDLKTSIVIASLINTCAKLYDLGIIKAKLLKDEDNTTYIKNKLYNNMLFTSSFDYLDVLNFNKQLINIFKTQMARRASLTFNVSKNNKSISKEEYVNFNLENDKKNNELFYDLNNDIMKITTYCLRNIRNSIRIDNEAIKRIYSYQYDCINIANRLNKIENNFIDLNIKNRYFQALKIAGVLAIINFRDVILEEDYIKAIEITDLINEDYLIFEDKLRMNNEEIIISYMDEYELEDIKVLSLIKNGFIKKDNEKSIYIFTKNLNIFDEKHLYKLDNNKIIRERLSDNFLISYKKLLSNNKEDNIRNCYNGFLCKEESLSNIANYLLNRNFAYSAFEFKEGIRNKENLINKFNLLILDIDDSEETIYEVADRLKDISNILCTTSDKNNLYKFRIIIPLSHYCNLNNEEYKILINYVKENYLDNIKIDILPKSQIFFSYQDSLVLLNDINYYLNIKNIDFNIEIKEKKIKFNNIETKNVDINSIFYRFKDTFEGNRNKNLILFINYCKDANLGKNDTLQYVYRLNSSFIPPLSSEELDNSIIPHLEKKFA